MATHYPNLGNQRDNLPAPYSGDQKLASFPESLLHSGNMMMYLNQATSAGSYSMMLPASSMPLDNCVEIPSVGGRNEMMFIPPTSDTSYGHLNTSAGDPVGSSVNGDPQVVPRMQLGIVDGQHNIQSQGLSLSLGTQMTSAISVPSFQYQYMNSGFPSSFSAHLPTSGKETQSCQGDGSNKSKELRGSECFPSNFFTRGNHNTVKEESWNPQMHSGMYQYEPADFADTILNSKFLKETQFLLDEVVNVQKALKQVDSSKRQNVHGSGLDASKGTDKRSSSQSLLPTTNGTLSDANIESNTNGSTELSSAERQDLQNKKTKLFSMMDEVDRRYKQYHHQMQIVVSSFDSIAGSGAAKAYTALAQQTISRHFRCLHDAISGQIQVIRSSLGEQETTIPRLRSVDHQIRQQRAMQQLGVMRHSWRPQRGLPESSVSTLRAWLFEHFLHPYPNDSEKIMLARQTGLTRNQVANWFINARVRLWKPMVEDMYKEEFGESEMNSKSIENASQAPLDKCSASEDGVELQDGTTSAAVDSAQPGKAHDLKSAHFTSVEDNVSTTRVVFQSDSHKDNVIHSGVIQLQDDQRPTMDDHSLLAAAAAAAATDDMSELNDFGIGGQVSLALGLHRLDSDMSDGSHIRGSETMSSFVGPGTMDYHCMDTGKQQHRFGSPHQLHDFIV